MTERLTRAGFARIASQISLSASDWAFGTLTMPHKLDEPQDAVSAKRFTDKIREMCAWIDEETATPDPAQAMGEDRGGGHSDRSVS